MCYWVPSPCPSVTTQLPTRYLIARFLHGSPGSRYPVLHSVQCRHCPVVTAPGTRLHWLHHHCGSHCVVTVPSRWLMEYEFCCVKIILCLVLCLFTKNKTNKQTHIKMFLIWVNIFSWFHSVEIPVISSFCILEKLHTEEYYDYFWHQTSFHQIFCLQVFNLAVLLTNLADHMPNDTR